MKITLISIVIVMAMAATALPLTGEYQDLLNGLYNSIKTNH